MQRWKAVLQNLLICPIIRSPLFRPRATQGLSMYLYLYLNRIEQ